MKLFVVFYLAGKIAFVSGPVDWSEAECRQLALTDFTAYGYKLGDVRAGCEWHDKKPATYDEPQPDFRFIGDKDPEWSPIVTAGGLLP